MLNGEKMKLRKIATTSTSLIRKTAKLSSFFSFFGLPAIGATNPAFRRRPPLGRLGPGVSVIVAVMWRGRAFVKCVVCAIHCAGIRLRTVPEMNGTLGGRPASGHEEFRNCEEKGYRRDE
jgi:hypothetical protein